MTRTEVIWPASAKLALTAVLKATPRATSAATSAKMIVSTPSALVVVVVAVVVVAVAVEVVSVADVLVLVTVDVVGNTGSPGNAPMSVKMNSASAPDSSISPDSIFAFSAVRAASHSVKLVPGPSKTRTVSWCAAEPSSSSCRRAPRRSPATPTSAMSAAARPVCFTSMAMIWALSAASASGESSAAASDDPTKRLNTACVPGGNVRVVVVVAVAVVAVTVVEVAVVAVTVVTVAVVVVVVSVNVVLVADVVVAVSVSVAVVDVSVAVVDVPVVVVVVDVAVFVVAVVVRVMCSGQR